MLAVTAKFVDGNWTANKKPIGRNCHKLVVTTLLFDGNWWQLIKSFSLTLCNINEHKTHTHYKWLPNTSSTAQLLSICFVKDECRYYYCAYTGSAYSILDHVWSQHEFGDSKCSLHQQRLEEKTWQKTYNLYMFFQDDVIKWKHFPRYWPFCEGNPSATGGFPSQKPVTRGFDAFCDLHLNKRLSK